MERKFRLINILIHAYLFSSLIIFVYGPLKYNSRNLTITLFFVILYQVVFFFGTKIGFNFIEIRPKKIIGIKEYTPNIGFFILCTISLMINLRLAVDIFGTLNLTTIFSTVIRGLSNRSELYNDTLKLSEVNNGSLITAIQTLISPLIYLLIPFGILNYSKIKYTSLKFLWFFIILIDIIISLMSGTTLGFFRIMMNFALSLIMMQLLNPSSPENKIQKMHNRRLLKYILITLAIIFVLGIFVSNTTSRMPEISNFLGSVYVDFDNIFIKGFPRYVQTALILFFSYISQGYHGFSLTFDYNWTSTFPFGSSMFLLSNAEKFGFNIIGVYNRMYQSKMSGEWSPTVNWHTVYTWLANDISHIGVVLFMFVFGILFSMVFKSCFEKSIISMALFTLMIQFLIFIPMNNVIFSNPLYFMPITIYIFCFLFSHKITIRRKRNENSIRN